MHSDCSFITGKTHAICQDYARSGTLPSGECYAIISDGCSSSEDTDFGSRILVKVAENALRKRSVLDVSFYKNVAKVSSVIAETMGLDNSSIDATLLIAVVLKNESKVSIIGDGFANFRNRDGSEYTIESRYPTGMPYYLNYFNSERRSLEFNKESTKQHITVYGDSPDGNFVRHDYDGIQVTEVFFDKDSTEAVSIISDGASSFSIMDGCAFKTILPEKTIQNLCSYKNFAGKFVQRRVGGFSRDCAKRNERHDDDLSIASIFLGNLP
jgi:Protein phosphatase 2C